MFNLSANAYDISRGICIDMDMEMRKIGIAITGFVISSFSYPDAVQDMIDKAASQSMVGDVGRYQQMNMAEAMGQPGRGAGSVASDMAGMQMGMMMGQQMGQQMARQVQNSREEHSADVFADSSRPVGGVTNPSGGSGVNFCPDCGTKVDGARFCPNCGRKLI